MRPSLFFHILRWILYSLSLKFPIGLQTTAYRPSGIWSQVKKTENIQYQSKVLENDSLIVSSGYWILITILLQSRLFRSNVTVSKFIKIRIFVNAKFWQGVAYRMIRYTRFVNKAQKYIFKHHKILFKLLKCHLFLSREIL